MDHNLTFTFSPVLGPLLLHVRSSRVRRPPTLVPPGGRPLLPRHHLLLPLLPLLSRATQQAGRQLADGGELDSRVNITSCIEGVLVHSRRYLCLLHRLCRHACQLQRKRRWGLAVLDWRQHCCWGEFFLQLADVEWCTVSGKKFMLSLPLTYGRCNWASKVLSVRGRFIFSGDMTCSWDDICTSCSWKQLLSPSVHLEVTYPIQSQHFLLPPLCFSSCGIWN